MNRFDLNINIPQQHFVFTHEMLLRCLKFTGTFKLKSLLRYEYDDTEIITNNSYKQKSRFGHQTSTGFSKPKFYEYKERKHEKKIIILF